MTVFFHSEEFRSSPSVHLITFFRLLWSRSGQPEIQLSPFDFLPGVPHPRFGVVVGLSRSRVVDPHRLDFSPTFFFFAVSGPANLARSLAIHQCTKVFCSLFSDVAISRGWVFQMDAPY